MEEGFVPQIFEGDQPPQAGFNAVVIRLKGGLRASLKWNEGQQQAQSAVETGYKLLWDLDLGLFDQLELPLTEEITILRRTSGDRTQLEIAAPGHKTATLTAGPAGTERLRRVLMKEGAQAHWRV